MKKILALLIVSAVVSAQAVTFTWNSNNIKISFNNATTIAAAGGITATLLYLGTDSTASIVDYSIENGISAQSVSTVSTGMASAKGKYTANYSKVIGSTFSENGPALSAGDYFTVLLSYTDSNAVTWYNLSSTVYRLPTDADDTTTGLTASFSHSFTMNDKGTALTAGGGWVQVPEPSTAALALAGLALLLKRRKA